MSVPIRVLWVEDADQWYNGTAGLLSKYALDVGSTLIIERYRGGENMDHLAHNEPYDIALVDHKLRDAPTGAATTGDVLIKLYLERNIVHTVIYYSENPADMNRIEFSDNENVACVSRQRVIDYALRSIESRLLIISPPDEEDE